ncbi:hypothetical protein [Jeotgalicoccus sp. WY2]|uniref:hypothetical protein n=1 Tax=Jeotgalicoccus sp. WY2 TaxID=2708346 RepID=UPI001BD1F77B|nr:hypothetical protein [Jeotgalicoccus sp. WY2]
MTNNNQRFYKRENDDYLEELKKHVDLIFHYTRKIDEGDMVFVYPLAVSLRVILHQTKYSDSLLELLGKRIDINYHSTSEYLRDYSDIDYLVGLIEPCEKILFQDGEVQGRINIFIPKLNSPFMKSGEVTWLNYHQFYNEQPVFLLNPEVAKKLTRFNFGSVNRIKVTRRNIIEYFANKSGGAHIDDQPPYNLYQLAENISSELH